MALVYNKTLNKCQIAVFYPTFTLVFLLPILHKWFLSNKTWQIFGRYFHAFDLDSRARTERICSENVKIFFLFLKAM